MGCLQSMEELNSGAPNTNPSSGREKDLNAGPPDCALTTSPRCLQCDKMLPFYGIVLLNQK